MRVNKKIISISETGRREILQRYAKTQLQEYIHFFQILISSIGTAATSGFDAEPFCMSSSFSRSENRFCKLLAEVFMSKCRSGDSRRKSPRNQRSNSCDACSRNCHIARYAFRYIHTCTRRDSSTLHKHKQSTRTLHICLCVTPIPLAISTLPLPTRFSINQHTVSICSFHRKKQRRNFRSFSLIM